MTLIFEIVSLVSAVLCVLILYFGFVLACYFTSLFSLLTNIFLLLPLSFFLQLSFVFNTVQLLLNLSWSSFDELVVNNIAAADSLLNFYKAKFHTGSKLVQSECDLRILLLVLKVVRELDFASREVVYFRL